MDAIALTRGLFRVLASGDVDLAIKVIAPDFVNREARVSPPACQLPGPAGPLATGAWLRSTYSDLAFPEFDLAERGDQIWCRLRMRGRQTGPIVRFRDGELDQVFPPTGREIDVEHVHVVTVRDGQIVRHEAVRDDLTMIRQLGFLPPRPSTMARIAAWRLSGKAARAADLAVQVAADAAAAVPSSTSAEPTSSNATRATGA